MATTEFRKVKSPAALPAYPDRQEIPRLGTVGRLFIQDSRLLELPFAWFDPEELPVDFTTLLCAELKFRPGTGTMEISDDGLIEIRYQTETRSTALLSALADYSHRPLFALCFPVHCGPALAFQELQLSYAHTHGGSFGESPRYQVIMRSLGDATKIWFSSTLLPAGTGSGSIPGSPADGRAFDEGFDEGFA